MIITEWLNLIVMFVAKAIDNTLGTAKTILIQKNKCFYASLSIALSNFIYLSIAKNIVQSDSIVSLLVVSVASGVGCAIAIKLGNHFSKEKTYVNVIMSDDIDAMLKLRDFLIKHRITNVVTDSYTLDLNKTITITAYAETRDESRLIDEYLNNTETKFKRMLNNEYVGNK